MKPTGHLHVNTWVALSMHTPLFKHGLLHIHSVPKDIKLAVLLKINDICLPLVIDTAQVLMGRAFKHYRNKYYKIKHNKVKNSIWQEANQNKRAKSVYSTLQ